ncbi:hypothetical protein [Caulobacter sp.]|uniref:hypothetical protein n=1 Tax=Caulobacter sp. TaxID=78 RepID=UPI003BAEAE07
MGRSVKKAGMILGGIALVATGVGALAGAGLLGASAAAVAGSAGGLTLFGVSVATIAQVGAGLTLAGQLMEGRPKVGGATGTAIDFKADPNAGIPVIVDRCGSGGNIVMQATTGASGKYFNAVTVHSLGPIEGYGAFRADDEVVNFTTPGRNGEEAAGKYLNRMWRVSRLGTDSQNALAYTATGSKDTPADHGGSVSGFWTSNHRLRSLACTLWGLEYDTKVFAGGVPRPREEVLGLAVYDPRSDSTYPGGSGPQRAHDEATWSFSGRSNPFLQALTFAIGRRRNGLLVAGLGLSLAAIDVAAHVEGANVSDLNGWRAAGVYYTTDPKYDVYRAMLMVGGGVPVPLGDRLSCMVNAPRVSMDTITADDLAGGISITGATSRRGRPNTLTARYLSEDHGWDIVPCSPVVIDDFVTADGRTVSRELEYRLCPSADQAAQLLAYEAYNAREYGPVVLALKPRWGGYKPGDCLTIDDARLGIVDQPMLVFMRDDDPETGVVTLTLRSETEAKHDFCLGRTADPPPVPGLTPYDLKPSVPEGVDWEVIGSTQAGPGGTLPVLVFTGVIRDVNASVVIVDYRQVFDTDPVTYGPWSSREWPVSSLELNGDDDPKVTLNLDGLAPGASYQWRLRYKTVRGVESPGDYLDGGDPVVVGEIDATTVKGRDVAQEILDSMDDIDTLFAEAATLGADLVDVEQRIDVLEVGSGTSPLGNQVQNPCGDQGAMVKWVTGTGVPWSFTSAGAPYRFISVPAGLSYNIFSDPIPANTAKPLTLALDMDSDNHSGNFKAHVRCEDGSGTFLGNAKTVAYTNTSTQWQRVSTTVEVSDWLPGTVNWRVAIETATPDPPGGLNPGGLFAFSRVMANLDAAPKPFADDFAPANILARVAVSEGALATVSGRVAAYWQVQVDAGTGQAFIRAQADGVFGDIIAAADRIALYNTVGGNLVPAMYVTSGKVRFTSDVQIDGNLHIAGSIQGPALASGSVVKARQFRAYAPGGGDTAGFAYSDHNIGGTDTTLVTISQNFAGNELTIKPQLNLLGLSGDPIICVGIKYDGAVIKKWYISSGNPSTAVLLYFTPSWPHTPSSGSHTYELCLLTKGVTQTVRVAERVLEMEERNGGYAVDTSGGSA